MDNRKQVIGIIGGLGPEASAFLYLNIVKRALKIDPTRYPSIVLWNVPITKELDERLMSVPQDDDNGILLLIVDAIRRMKDAGATVIGIPCNTIHFLFEKFSHAFDDIRVLSIIDCTIDVVVQMGKRSVGLLGTSTTVKSGLYTRPLSERGIQTVVPRESSQKRLMSIINGVLEGHERRKLTDQLISIIDELGVDTVILACTELPLIVNQNDVPHVTLISTLDALTEGLLE